MPTAHGASPPADCTRRRDVRLADRPAREPRGLDRPGATSPRARDDDTLPSAASAERRAAAVDPDIAFSCEWWPPD